MGSGASSFGEYGFDEAPSLTFGPWGEWSGTNMAQTQVLAGIAEGSGTCCLLVDKAHAGCPIDTYTKLFLTDTPADRLALPVPAGAVA